MTDGPAAAQRVLHVVPSYIPAWRYGGPIRSVHGLCKALVKSGVDVHVFTTNVDGDGISDVPLGRPVDLDGVQVWYFPTGRLRRLYRSAPMGAELRRRISGFDIVHLHSVFLWPTWAAARAAADAGVPYVVAPRGMLVRELIERKSSLAKTAWIRLIERRTLERASGIHVTSETERLELERFGFDTPPPFLVPNGVELPQGFEPAAAGPAEAPRILFLGRINWKKGLDRLIPAMHHVPAAKLIVAGNDEEAYTPRLRELARDSGVAERVEFVGAVEEADKWRLLGECTLLALPSYSENFGIVVVEAMAAGRPVVVTPEVGLADTVEESGAGVVAPGDPEAFGAALARLLRDDERLVSMGRNGRRAFADRFTWSRQAEAMLRQYAAIAGGPSPA